MYFKGILPIPLILMESVHQLWDFVDGLWSFNHPKYGETYQPRNDPSQMGWWESNENPDSQPCS